ncbi:Spx/MgsR family RNA polymerase-binding regulatory protein [Thalassotalea agarivorans]|uniref:Transcriptional regulator, Spx/MgsR family n=1 Tax=Thalassotalea agarivorans TaxID=349064 RepID=A0A1I0DKN2_THASX|nr:Spx/MgsR family RNA polymerase-binding regulatory protein [Thalassotalea agarivorans]SET32381.1 transcriptional regulator, Spx/MgsR family [Thalassotalea agarivorans]
MTITLYGINNCDTVKKAMKWLDNAGIEYTFHDYKKAGLSESLFDEFASNIALDVLINKRSTTYRNLSDDVKAQFSLSTITPEVLAQPTLLKRPIMHMNGNYKVGFKAADYQEYFDNA